MRFFYNIALGFLFLTYLPKALYMCLRYGKYKSKFTIPKIPATDKPIVWIHACSVGETKAASTLAKHFKEQALIISSTTDTGHALAKVLIPAHAHIMLPFDFRFLMRRLAKQISPTLLILIESDCWLNLLLETPCRKALVSATLSERSLKRYQKLPSFARLVYSQFDFIGTQNQTYQQRFATLNIKTTITGNLKLDLPAPPSNPEDFAITIGSTHAGEEEAIVRALKPLIEKYPQLKLFVIPRHPERFALVEKLLKTSKAIPITEMGVLQNYYARSKLAIVGGSFVGNIGGHNILEPILNHIPVFYGPQMHAQQELVELVGTAGKQLEITELCDAVEKCITDPDHYGILCAAAAAVDKPVRGVSLKTFESICNNSPDAEKSLPVHSEILRD